MTRLTTSQGKMITLYLDKWTMQIDTTAECSSNLYIDTLPTLWRRRWGIECVRWVETECVGWKRTRGSMEVKLDEALRWKSNWPRWSPGWWLSNDFRFDSFRFKGHVITIASLFRHELHWAWNLLKGNFKGNLEWESWMGTLNGNLEWEPDEKPPNPNDGRLRRKTGWPMRTS